MRLAVYARQSKSDRDRVPSTAWQIDACKTWAEQHGHEVVAIFADENTSGYRKVARPDFAALLETVRTGAVDGTLVWKLDRLSRQGQWGPDVLRFMDARAVHDSAFLSVVEEIDTSSAAGELILGVRLSIAKGESEAISTRWKGAKSRAAQAGVPTSGGHRWFGWVEGKREVDPVEAELIVDAAQRVVGGASLRSIALAWNAAGVVTSTGRKWTPQTLRQMLLSPRMIGVRTHHGVEVGPGTWPPILDRDTHNRLRRILEDPDRKQLGRDPSGILTGHAKCGRCGTGMRVGTSPSGKRRYQCPPKPEGCNGCTILADEADDVVERRIRARVVAGKLPTGNTGSGVKQLADRLADLEARQKEAATDYYSVRIITKEQFAAVSESLGRQIAATKAALGRAERERSTVTVNVADLVARWGDISTLEKRSVVYTMCETLKIAPGTGGRFDRSRIKIRWRH